MPIRSMDAFAPPSIRAESTVGTWLRAGGTGLLALVLAFSLFSLPNPPDAGLDGSWQEMLLRARSLGMQFGRELIFTWGPWGFLTSLYHLGKEEAASLLLWQTAGQLAVAAALLALTRRAGPWRQIAFVVLVVAVHWLFMDALYFALIALVVVEGLMRRDISWARLAGWALALGFLSQIKFTYMVLAAAGVAASAVCWAIRGSWPKAGGVAGAYGTAVVLAWIAAGQNPDNLYPYLMRSLEVAKGYGDAMGNDESWPVFLWGAGLALICAAYVWAVWTTVAERALAVGAALFLGLGFFLMWKESFTRADLVPLGGHVFGLFALVAMLAPALGGLLFPAQRWHWFDASVPFCLLAVACFDPSYYRLGPRVSGLVFERTIRAAGRLVSLPGEWERAYEQARAREAVPAIRAAVGDSTVDVYDFNLGVALLNALALEPRPVFQGYSAYTPSLEGWNLRFYQSARAPAFLVWSDERLDNRYPGEDDAMLVAGLPGHYEPLFPEGRYWLLRRRSPLSKGPMERPPVLSRRVALSEELVLPPERTRALWLQADAVPNALGRLRAALYKPAAINLTTTDDAGNTRVWRLLPRVAKVGFVLVPTLETGADVASFLRGEAHSWVHSLHFEAPGGQEEFWSHVDVTLLAMPEIALRPTLPLPSLVSVGVFDHPPLWVTSASGEEVFPTSGGNALLLPAASEVLLAVPKGASRFSGAFGLRAGAYTEGGRTGGVGFDLDAVWATGRRERMWSRFLDPVRRTADRGVQHLEVALPADGPSRLELHMAPATAGDDRWAWSYVAAMKFTGPEKP
jgi:hypothetical protein